MQSIVFYIFVFSYISQMYKYNIGIFVQFEIYINTKDYIYILVFYIYCIYKYKVLYFTYLYFYVYPKYVNTILGYLYNLGCI